MGTNLTDVVRRYQRQELELKQVVDLVAVTIYNYSALRNRWDEDQCSDFLCYFYGRIAPMVLRFREQGSPFEALLKVAVHYQMKTFGLKVRRQIMEERVLTSGDFWERTLLESTLREESPPAETEYKPLEENILVKMNKNRGLKRKLLCLLLREHEQVTESFLVHFTTITGYERVWVEEQLEKVRELTRAATEKKETCRQRRNQALFNVCCIHNELRLYQSAEERRILAIRLDKELKTIKRAEKTIAGISARPTHQQIARLLNVPKGTVDSGLHYLSQKYGKTEIP